MDYNPLAAKLRAAEKKVLALERRRASLTSEAAWAKRFRLKSALEKESRLATDLRREEENLERLDARCKEATSTSELLNAQNVALEDDAKLGWNPTRWFSAERTKAKERLDTHRQRIGSHLALTEDLVDQRDAAERKVREARDTLHHQREDIAIFKAFDPKINASDIRKIDEELPLREVERDALRSRKEEVDRQLTVPLAALRSYAEESDGLRTRIKTIRERKDDLEYERNQADRLNQRISNAANSYERRELHLESERRFGNGSPGRVASELNRQIRALEREIDQHNRQVARIQRDMEKVERRIKRIGEVASRNIRMIIIDGKNACFEGNRFIGLAALIPTVEEVSKKYDVTVVFDASIRRDLNIGDDDLRRALPHARVHVVASRMKADETILDSAREPTSWVLSNDRFAEYRDKPPVKEGRLIRHEILHGRVMVHDLNISAQFHNRHH